jgi:hypothetical protein
VGLSIRGILDFLQRNLVCLAGVNLRAKHELGSQNSTVELLHGGVSGAEL